MEIVVRRDAFRSGFEVILFAPGCAKKESSDDEGDGRGGVRSEKAGTLFSLRNSPRDTRGIHTRAQKDTFNSLFPPFFLFCKNALFQKHSRPRRESVADICYEDIDVRFRTPFHRENGTVSKASICILFKWIRRGTLALAYL